MREASEIIAEQHGITPESVRSTYKRMKNNGGKVHGNMIFSSEDEEAFVGLLQGWDLLGRGLSQEDFLRSIREEFHLSDSWDSHDWLEGFLKRHKARLSPRTVKELKGERVSRNVEDQVKEFVAQSPLYLKEKGLREKRPWLIRMKHESKWMVANLRGK